MSRLKLFFSLRCLSLLAASFTLFNATSRPIEAQTPSARSRGAAPPDAAVVARLNADIAALTRWPSRAVGTAGNDAAADYMKGRFDEILGRGNVKVESYEVTAPVTKSAQLTINGRTIKVLPIYPNSVVPSSTPLRGISGPMIYAGRGNAADFNGQKIEGAIVLLDFNSGLGWVTAADLGARAIVFLEPVPGARGQAPTTRGEAERKFASLPVEIPRFYLRRADAGSVTGMIEGAPPSAATTYSPYSAARLIGQAKLQSQVKWERVQARNILGTLKGTDSALAGKPGGTIVINAYYDSMAVTPDLAPGAEAAANAAALLEVARAFKARPAKYSILFVANGAHHMALAGVRQFLARHFIDSSGKAEKAMTDEIASYRGFIGLDLTSRSDTIGIFAKSSFYNQMTVGAESLLLNQFSGFAKAVNRYAAAEAKRRGVKDEEFYVDGITGRGGRTWRSYLPVPLAFDSEAAMMAQKPSITFATANDARQMQDTPFDTADRVNVPNVARQLATLDVLLTRAMNDIKSLPDPSKLSPIFGYAVGRAIYRDDTRGASFLPDTPLPDEALIKILPPAKKPATPLSAADKATRDAKDREYLAKLEGAQAVAVVIDRNTNYKTYSGVRGAFIERATYSKPTPGQVSVAHFVFLGPRVGDPKGGGAPPNEIEAYTLDKNGRISFAPDMGSERQRFSPVFTNAHPAIGFKDEKLNSYNVDASVITFAARATTLYDTLDQRYFTILRELTVLDGQTDANPVEYGFLRPAVAPGASDAEPIAMLFSKPGARFKLIMQMGLLGKRLVLLQTTPKEGTIVHEGAGFVVPNDPEANSVVRVAHQTARDLWVLDQQRIRLLKGFGIANERVDTLHGSAGCPSDSNERDSFDCPTEAVALPNGGAIAAATTALDKFQYDKFYLESRKAFGLESRAYPDVEATAQDVLKGIIFYLALLLPFSYFVERLVFGFPDIRKQIAGASIVFLFIFTGIRFVHPAFELASTPFIILLAFIILALTVVVTSFLSSKFEAEIKRLKQGVHFADVGRLSAIGAALGLGIANMRRRPMRTALTCVTLVLLTFTVLSFTSVTANISNFARPYGDPNRPPAYEGLMVRNADWGPMQLASANSMRNEFGQRFGVVAPRAWYLSRDQGEGLQLRVNNAADPSQFFYAPALVGFTPEEGDKQFGSPIPKTLIAGKWFDGTRGDVCLLPRAMLIKPSVVRAERQAIARARGGNDDDSKQAAIAAADDHPPLGLTEANAVGSKIQIAGQEMEVIGVFDDNKFFEARDLDDEQFTPVDYQNEQNKQNQSSTGIADQKGQEAQVQRYQHMDANALLIIPYDTAINLGASTRSIAAGFRDSVSGRAELEGLMNRAALGIFGSTRTEDGKLQSALYSSVETAGYDGFAALIIPITIAALIIANTMLGSVFERTKEIGIYSSVGLAPIHVAALFIAEAMVYAVLGSISGYLIAQLVAKIVTGNNLLPGITLNYSSSSAIIATLIVMATVLLSTLYPAWAASRLSNPDTDRKWKVNEPIGDIWRFQFPFTVSGLQPLGVAQFLADFFESHTDTSVGKFYTDRVTLMELPLRQAVEVLNAGLDTALAANAAALNKKGRKPKAVNGAPTNGAPANGAATNGAPIVLNGDTNGHAPVNGIVDGASSAAPVVASPLIVAEALPVDLNLEVYRLSMRVWLAPFDMGVSQDVDIVLLPASEPGLYELQLRLVRQSGEIAAWKRVNRQFIGDLRKQLLVWRTVSREGQQEYILRGRAHVAGQVVPTEIPGAAVGSLA